MSNNILKSLLALSVVTLVYACNEQQGDSENNSVTPAADMGADLVFLNGNVYTVDTNRSWAQAVAVKDGRVTYVGSDSQAEQYIGDNSQVIDLQGRMVLPAFQDSHIHPIAAGIEASSVNLNGLAGLDEYQTAVTQYALANPELQWILGGGWSMSIFGAGGTPHKRLLDELVSERPVFLTSSDGHTGWANSAALQIAGINSETPDPVDGRIDRDPTTGEAIGSLQEGAMNLITAHIPPTSLETRKAGLRYAIDLLNSFGITSIQDAIVNPEDLETYRAMDADNQLSLHVVASLWWDRKRGLDQIPELRDQRQEYTQGHVRATTVKIMQDGILENYTAAMLEPYLLGGGTRGIPMLEPGFLKQVVSQLDADGFQVHFHAIGDGAIRSALDAVEAAREENGDRGNRHHISHLQVIHPEDIPRFKTLNVVANFQPLWANADEYITELNLPAIGELRTSWMYPIQSVIQAGGRIAFGSDWSVSTANPFHQMETAVTRQAAQGDRNEVFIPAQRISLEAAIAAFTIGAAYVNKHEADTGSIEVGKLADLVVLDQNLFEIPSADISNTNALLTLFEGKVVHGALTDFKEVVGGRP